MKHLVWISCFLLLGYVWYTISSRNTLLGTTRDGVSAYATNGASQDVNRVVWKGQTIVTGLKWECVEFVRRYLLLTRGLTFKNVKQADEIWGLLTFIDAETKMDVPCMHYNIGTIRPQSGDVLVWSTSKIYPSGHVAIILRGTEDKLGMVEIAEQQGDAWAAPDYSRRISLDSTPHLLGIVRVYHKK
jgi:glutathionylspermidine amidase/synthetase